MEKEADAGVLAFINEKRLSGEKLTPVEIITRMGVFDARTQASASAWLASGDNVIATIWAELVTVGAGGRWFYLESLDPHQRIGGGDRSAQQLQRAKDRLQLLKYAMDENRSIRAVLQANRVPVLTMESDKAAKVGVRVPDSQEWHVASWNPDDRLAVLVRGERGWLPTEDELQSARAKGGAPVASPAGGGAQASQDDLQGAAVAYLVQHFSSYGYKAEHVAGQGMGYDLLVSDKKGNTLLKLVAKGLGAGVRSFQLSAEERACAKAGDPWRLAVVTDAGTPGVQHKLYRSTEFEKAPGLAPEL